MTRRTQCRLLADSKMKAFLVLYLECMMLLKISALTSVNFTATLSSEVVAPVTANTVYLDKPYCYFDNVSDATCSNPDTCDVWLVAAQDSARDTFDNDKTASDFLDLSPYPTAFDSGQKNYFLTHVGPQASLSCSVNRTTPSYFLVGENGVCTTANCNGVLPEGSAMSFKYLLVNSANNLVAETDWSDNVTLKTAKDPDGLGGSYAGRSAAMVVITTILSLAMALLLLLLLIGLILACCYSKQKTQSYDTSVRRETSIISSLRIPSYDVHHLKSPAPYDNPMYEQDLKKRYTTSSTLPQKTTSVVTTVYNDSPDEIILEKQGNITIPSHDIDEY